MAQRTVYKTRQKDEILFALKNIGEKHITVDELCSALAADGKRVGRTTVYRQLERMCEQGSVRRYDNVSGGSACYQYIESDDNCSTHFHLKCVHCGSLIHLDCEHIDGLFEHIGKTHSFKIDKLKTVLYGACEKCLEK